MRINELIMRLQTLQRKNGNLKCKMYVGEGNGMLDDFICGKFTDEAKTDYLMLISNFDRLNIEASVPPLEESNEKDAT